MNAIKGVVIALAAAGTFLTGAQAIAAPAPTTASSEAEANVIGEVVAVVNTKTIKVKVDADTVLTVKTDAKTVITGKVTVGVKVDVAGKKVEGDLLASGIIVLK